jgi:hypothetical protein
MVLSESQMMGTRLKLAFIPTSWVCFGPQPCRLFEYLIPCRFKMSRLIHLLAEV